MFTWCRPLIQVGAEANALSEPPEDYGRKAKTQEN
jgi:hypothetical protein